LQPFLIVFSEIPVARETILMLHLPMLSASAAANKRLLFSSRKGFSKLYFLEKKVLVSYIFWK